MGLLKDFFLGTPVNKEFVPVTVVRYWRELNEEKILGVCRSIEEANYLIRNDMDSFGTAEARALLSYHLNPVHGVRQ
jgi:hypothetical protein